MTIELIALIVGIVCTSLNALIALLNYLDKRKEAYTKKVQTSNDSDSSELPSRKNKHR